MATKDVEPVGVEEVELKEANVEDYLHVVWGAQDVSVEVDFHIAIVGEVGSGRSAFVNAIRGYVIKSINLAFLYLMTVVI